MDNTPQQEFLRDAMHQLGMTRQEFADRLGIARRRLDNWLLPDGSNEWRPMDSMAQKFITEILEKSRGQHEIVGALKMMLNAFPDYTNDEQLAARVAARVLLGEVETNNQEESQ